MVKLENSVSAYKLLVGGSIAAGIFLLPFGFTSSIVLLLIFRFVSALFYGFGNVIANVLIAKLAPTEVRGRVISSKICLSYSS